MSETCAPGTRRRNLAPTARVGLAGLALAAVLALAAGLCWRGAGADAHRLAASEALAAGRLTDAARAIERLQRSASLTPDDHLLAARVAAERCEYDEALRHVAEIQPPHPAHIPALVLASQVHIARDHLVASERHLHQALALDPDRPDLRRLLLDVHLHRGRDPQVLDDLRELSRADLLSSRELLTWTRARLGLPDPLAPDNLDRLAYAKLADPTDLWSSLALGELLRRAGRLDEASRAVADLVDVVAPVWALRGRIALDAGRPDQAAACLARAPQDHPDIARLQARLALDQGDPAAALVSLAAAEATEPGRLDAARMRAEALDALGRAAEARSAHAEADRLAALADRVLALLEGRAAPGSTTHHELARSCLDLGDHLLAREWYRRVEADSPGDPVALEALDRLDLQLSPELASAFEPAAGVPLPAPAPTIALRDLRAGRSG